MPNQLTGQELPGLAEAKLEGDTPDKNIDGGIQNGIRRIDRNPNTGHRGAETDQIRDLNQRKETSRGAKRPTSLPYRITGDSQRPVAHI